MGILVVYLLRDGEGDPRVLTQSLAPLLDQGGVVINLVESRSELGSDLTDLNSPPQQYDPARVYLPTS